MIMDQNETRGRVEGSGERPDPQTDQLSPTPAKADHVYDAEVKIKIYGIPTLSRADEVITEIQELITSKYGEGDDVWMELLVSVWDLEDQR
jgi:hypothetical protein